MKMRCRQSLLIVFNIFLVSLPGKEMFYIMRSHHRNLCRNAEAKIDIHKIFLKNQKAKKRLGS